MTKERYDRIETLFRSFQYGFPDQSGMSEFIDLTAREERSVNWSVLRDRYNHLATLEKQSARVKRWDQLYRDARGVYLEISRSMAESEQGGNNVQ